MGQYVVKGKQIEVDQLSDAASLPVPGSVRMRHHQGVGLGPAKLRSGGNPSIMQKPGLRNGNHATQTAFDAEVNIMIEDD
jgi:hypothetical protein